MITNSKTLTEQVIANVGAREMAQEVAEAKALRMKGIDEKREASRLVVANAELAKNRFEELKIASEPLIEFMRKYYDPMTYAVVTNEHVRVLGSLMGMPIDTEE